MTRPLGAPERYLLPLPKTSDLGLLLVERIRRWVEVSSEQEDFGSYIDRDRPVDSTYWADFTPSGLDGKLLHSLSMLNADDRATVRAAYANPKTPGAGWVRAALECLKVYDENIVQRQHAVGERIDAHLRLDAYLMDPATIEDRRRLNQLELRWATSHWRIKAMDFLSPGWDSINHIDAESAISYVAQLYQAGHPTGLTLVSRASVSRNGHTRHLVALPHLDTTESEYRDPTIEAFAKLTVLNPMAPGAAAASAAKTAAKAAKSRASRA